MKPSKGEKDALLRRALELLRQSHQQFARALEVDPVLLFVAVRAEKGDGGDVVVVVDTLEMEGE